MRNERESRERKETMLAMKLGKPIQMEVFLRFLYCTDLYGKEILWENKRNGREWKEWKETVVPKKREKPIQMEVFHRFLYWTDLYGKEIFCELKRKNFWETSKMGRSMEIQESQKIFFKRIQWDQRRKLANFWGKNSPQLESRNIPKKEGKGTHYVEMKGSISGIIVIPSIPIAVTFSLIAQKCREKVRKKEDLQLSYFPIKTACYAIFKT